MTDQDTTIRLREVARARSRPPAVDPAELALPDQKVDEPPADDIGQAVDYLVPNTKVMVEFYEHRPVGVELPITVDLKDEGR